MTTEPGQLLFCGVSFLLIGLLSHTSHALTVRRNSLDIKDKLANPEDYQLAKASCEQIQLTMRHHYTHRGDTFTEPFSNTYIGTFVTQAGTRVVIPGSEKTSGFVLTGIRTTARNQGGKMLRLLFNTDLHPLSAPIMAPFVAGRITGRQNNLRSQFLLLLRKSREKRPSREQNQTNARRCSTWNESKILLSPELSEGLPMRRFDCLLLMGTPAENSADTVQDEPVVVGILGEDRITRLTPEMFGFTYIPLGVTCLGIFLLTILCIQILSSESAQKEARSIYPGTNARAWAAVGLMLCLVVTAGLIEWTHATRANLIRLIEEFPPLMDSPTQD